MESGQMSIMNESVWKVEHGTGVSFGSDSSDPELVDAVEWLKGKVITNVKLPGSMAELQIELDHQFLFKSSSPAENETGWALFLRDPKLFPRPEKWRDKWFEKDHGLWIHFERGRLELELGFNNYCSTK